MGEYVSFGVTTQVLFSVVLGNSGPPRVPVE